MRPGGARGGAAEGDGRGSAGNESHTHTTRAPPPPQRRAPFHTRVRVGRPNARPVPGSREGAGGRTCGGRRRRASKGGDGAPQPRGAGPQRSGGEREAARGAQPGDSHDVRPQRPRGHPLKARVPAEAGLRTPPAAAQAREERERVTGTRPDTRRRPKGDGCRPAHPHTPPGRGTGTGARGPGPGPTPQTRGGRAAGTAEVDLFPTTDGRERPPGRARARAHAERGPPRGGWTRRSPRTSTPKTPRARAATGP